MSRKFHLAQLASAVPNGFPVDSSWLSARGISRQSVAGWVASGWLQRIARGLFVRPSRSQPGNPIPWETAVAAMTDIMGYPVHVGGLSALAVHGRNHYIMLGRERIDLYGTPPKWSALPCFDADFVEVSKSLFPAGFEISQVKWEAGTSYPASSPVRAIFEVVEDIPSRKDFDHVDKLFEGMHGLRPSAVAEALHLCASIKAKRLFAVFADKHRHQWWKRVDLSGVDFGSGDRQVVKHGRLHPVWRVTIPDFMMPGYEPSPGEEF